MKAPTLGIAKAVIEAESNSDRFEQFANAIVSRIEGGEKIFSTSKSWDLGRDGKSRQAKGVFVCSSLRQDVDGKAKADALRLAADPTVKINRVYFCSSHELSEKHQATLRADLRKIFPSLPEIEVMGNLELAEAALEVSSPDVQSLIWKFYAAEVDDCIRLLEEDRSDDGQDAALRLALVAMGPEQARDIRIGIYTAALIDTLATAGHEGLSSDALTKAVSDGLKLPRLISFQTIKPYVAHLERQGVFFVTPVDLITLTAKGIELHNQSNSKAAAHLLEGRMAVRSQLTSLLGRSLSESQFDDIWRAVEDRLATLLYTHGESIVSASAAIIEGRLENAGKPDEYVKTVEDLASCAAATTSESVAKEEVRQAVLDLFQEGIGPGCDWLLKICANFIALCSMGLEQTSAKVINRTVTSLELVPDTDVILSLLCSGEEQHSSIEMAHKEWRKAGGKLLLGHPVALEVAHHAWMAHRDFSEVEGWLPGTEEDGSRLISNAFVRGFATLLRAKKARKSQWSTYINQFREATDGVTTKVASILEREYSFGTLPPSSNEEDSVYQKVLNALESHSKKTRGNAQEMKIRRDKSKRDAELAAALSFRRKMRAKIGSGPTLLVSSSERLSRLSATLPLAGGGDRWSITPAVWLHLVSMLPGVSMGLPAMRAFLFDRRRHGIGEGVERLLLRSVKDSGEYSFGWARRVTLETNLRQAIVKIADELGVAESELEKRILRAGSEKTDLPILSRVFAEALNRLPADSKLERELKEAKMKIKELEVRLKKKEDRSEDPGLQIRSLRKTRATSPVRSQSKLRK